MKWDALENVKIGVLENATEFNHYILSFNVNTNQWSAHYIYKRLKFLGSRIASQLLTLLFLAVWHGFHSGYYISFFMEFLVIYLERDVRELFNYGISTRILTTLLISAPTTHQLLHISIWTSPTMASQRICICHATSLHVRLYGLVPLSVRAYDVWQILASVCERSLLWFDSFCFVPTSLVSVTSQDTEAKEEGRLKGQKKINILLW